MYILYKTRYPDRPCPEHTRFYVLYKNLQEYGNFIKPKSRVSIAINDDSSFSVLAKLIENPHVSLRTVADELNMTYSSVQRIAKKHKYHAVPVN
ncbi:hypothetical protein ACI65C_013633 [Semiaphis heraclei]